MSDFLSLLDRVEYYGSIAIYLGSFVYFLIDTHRFIKKVERDIASSQKRRDAAKKLIFETNTEEVEPPNGEEDYWIEMPF